MRLAHYIGTNLVNYYATRRRIKI